VQVLLESKPSVVDGKSSGSRHLLPNPFLETARGRQLTFLPSLSPACGLQGNLIFIESHTPPRAHGAPRTPICDRVAAKGQDRPADPMLLLEVSKATKFLSCNNLEPGKVRRFLGGSGN
jgi:hypothetical protein